MSDTAKEELLSVIQSVCQAEMTEIPHSTPFGVIIPKENLAAVCENLHRHPACYFDMLSCITGVDNGVDAGTMEVIYHLYSIPHQRSLALKVILPRDHPNLESISAIWKSANWMEREVYDMFGIIFNHHPDLRRILLPADWKGFPLKKDYQQEEYYRGMKIDY
jgi:NADH-quinone oxidoreductase subunit C